MSVLSKGACLSLLLLAGCSSGDDFDFCSNPLGTSAQQGGNDDVICFQSCGDDCYHGCLKFKLDATSQTMRAVIVTGIIPGISRTVSTKDCPTTGPCVTIADVGKVDCMASFVDKDPPASGYSNSVPLVVGHGYVIKLDDGTYGNIYLDNIANNEFEMKANILWYYSAQ